MNRFPRRVVLFTGLSQNDPVVFYELRSQEAFRRLNSGVFAKYPLGEISTEWSPRRFRVFRRELQARGLSAPAFRETAKGTWVVVAPELGRPQEVPEAAQRFLPSIAVR